jgi:hypothetical protein
VRTKARRRADDAGGERLEDAAAGELCHDDVIVTAE